jgi:hypothetical protein
MSSLPVEKRCLHCTRMLPLGEFAPLQRAKDGHLSVCRECTRKAAKRRRDLRNRGEGRRRYGWTPEEILEALQIWETGAAPASLREMTDGIGAWVRRRSWPWVRERMQDYLARHGAADQTWRAQQRGGVKKRREWQYLSSFTAELEREVSRGTE